jgi:hypothetical protein
MHMVVITLPLSCCDKASSPTSPLYFMRVSSNLWSMSVLNLNMRLSKDLNLKRWKLSSFRNGMSSYQEYLSSKGQIKLNSTKFFKVRYIRKYSSSC